MAEKKAKNYYYDEAKVQALLTKYQESTIIRDGVCLQRDMRTENELAREVQKIVVAIIFTYKYQRFEPYEDLVQHGMAACASNFRKFSPGKGSSYDYFSIIAKISLLNYTIRRKKHRNGVDFDKVKNSIRVGQPYDFDKFIQELEINIFQIIDTSYLGNKRKKYIKIASLIIEYLRKTRSFVSKSDLYCWCRSYGVKQNIVREFVKEMSLHHGDLYIEGEIYDNDREEE
jgi:hypothetical protein